MTLIEYGHKKTLAYEREKTRQKKNMNANQSQSHHSPASEPEKRRKGVKKCCSGRSCRKELRSLERYRETEKQAVKDHETL